MRPNSPARRDAAFMIYLVVFFAVWTGRAIFLLHRSLHSVPGTQHSARKRSAQHSGIGLSGAPTSNWASRGARACS
jgi:hypothetical protein